MNLTSIKSSHSFSDLVVIRSRLESEGIRCFYKNELTTQILNYIPAFIAELQVFESDLHRVKEIMIELGEPDVVKTQLMCPEWFKKSEIKNFHLEENSTLLCCNLCGFGNGKSSVG